MIIFPSFHGIQIKVFSLHSCPQRRSFSPSENFYRSQEIGTRNLHNHSPRFALRSIGILEGILFYALKVR